jgi:hypothetical protein
MKSKKKLAIVYRIYPKVSKIPPVFADDKYKLSELCLSSFVRALKDIDYKIWVLLDNCPDEYFELFKLYFGDRAELIATPCIGNPGTFGKQMQILLTQDFSENIYFAEDDYFYLAPAFTDMLDFFDSEHKVDFLTPYNHADYFELDLHQYKKSEIKFKDTTWRTESTTCMTFLTNKTILKKNYSIFDSYTKKNYDASLWLAMTKKRIFNPLLYPKYLFTNFELFKIFAKAWIYTPFKLLFGKTYKLYSPNPSLATHMDNKYLAPEIDWYELFKKEKKILLNSKKNI